MYWKVWCLLGHNFLHPSSSYGRPGGGGGKRHKGNQLLHMLLQLERARNGIKIFFLVPNLMKNVFIFYQKQDLPANTSVLSHKFSEVTFSGRSLSYILLPRPLLGTISFSMISCWSPLPLDVGLSHLSRLLSSSVFLGTIMSVLKLVLSNEGVLLGLVL